MIETYQFTITYESKVDSDTCEILETRIVKKSDPKKPVKKIEEEEPIPKLYLKDNKFRLTQSAVALLNATPGSKIDIEYQHDDGVVVPVIATDEVFGTGNGNKLTKSNTVAFKGVKHDVLAEHGSEFELKPHPLIEGRFILDSGKTIIEELPEKDENIELDLDSDLPFDLDLEDFVDLEDNSNTIDESIFKF